ncbi:MAG: hypothetical protein AB1Z98_11730 [Nannocystaceae bacterium]
MEEALAPSVLGAGLTALRWWSLLSVQALWRHAVGRSWLAVSAGLAVALAAGGPSGSVAAGSGSEVGLPWLAAGSELVLGALIGLVVSLPGLALLGAADATAQVLRAQRGPWRALTVILVAATALSLGLHRPLLLGAAGMLEAWPVGQPGAWIEARGAVPLGQLAHGLALLAITLATPALLAGAVMQLVAGMAGRGSPGGAFMAVTAGPWLSAAAALVATGASWAAYDDVWAARALGP